MNTLLQAKARAGSRWLVVSGLFASLMLALFASSGGLANASDAAYFSLGSGTPGSTFTIKATGFAANEQVVMWTNNPDGTALEAGFVYADATGNFTLKVATADPNDVAEDGNVTTLIDSYDSDGNHTQYWLTTLKASPALGNYSLVMHGMSSDSSQTYSFTIANASVISADPASASMGSSFTIKASGFVANERVALWTTNPDGTSMEAGYVYADGNGNFTLVVNSADPNGVATAGNFTTLVDNYDSDGVHTQYWSTTLKDNPAVGAYLLVAHGQTSNNSQPFSFSIS